MHINDWNSGSENQHVSLQDVFVLLAVGLQKPNPKYKAKDHQNALSKRLALWKDGDINKLLREGRIIQSRIGKFKGSNHPDKAKVFAKLVLEGQINSALRFLSETTDGGVLTLTDDVMTQLKQKHPEPQLAKLGSVLFGPLNDEIPESIYSQINGEMVRQAALRTKGSGGPSGVDANGFRSMLACKSFKQSSTRLCEAIARMTKTLCTQYIDPTTIEELIASRLIPLDKGEGAVKPIGVGEVIRRISAKCVKSFAKKDVVEASGSLQLCAGQKSGSEAAIHAMNTLFEAENEHNGNDINTVNYDSFPELKKGINLPKNDSEWSTANDYFKCALQPSDPITLQDLNSKIKLLNDAIYSYFANNYGHTETIPDKNMVAKYKEYTVKELKKALKNLKSRKGELSEIKYVSRTLRDRLRNNGNDADDLND
ncbi:Hypothetical predicted protein, partial [Paramuricea clavata]